VHSDRPGFFRFGRTCVLLATFSFCCCKPGIRPPFPAHRSTVCRATRRKESAATPHRSRLTDTPFECRSLLLFPRLRTRRDGPEKFRKAACSLPCSLVSL
jgi:hypothetical protein